MSGRYSKFVLLLVVLVLVPLSTLRTGRNSCLLTVPRSVMGIRHRIPATRTKPTGITRCCSMDGRYIRVSICLLTCFVDLQAG